MVGLGVVIQASALCRHSTGVLSAHLFLSTQMGVKSVVHDRREAGHQLQMQSVCFTLWEGFGCGHGMFGTSASANMHKKLYRLYLL